MQWLWHLLFEFSQWLWHLLSDNFYGMQWLWHHLFQNFAVAVAFSSIIWYGISSSTILQWRLAFFELSPSVLDSLDVLLFCSSCKQEVAGATVDNGIWCADFVTWFFISHAAVLAGLVIWLAQWPVDWCANLFMTCRLAGYGLGNPMACSGYDNFAVPTACNGYGALSSRLLQWLLFDNFAAAWQRVLFSGSL